MITVISADGTRVDRVGHALTETEAAVVTKVLAAEGIRVEPTEPDGLGVVHLWAKQAYGTAVEVRTLRAFSAVTDGPLAYHEAVTR
jgi:hypothetical protein